MKLEDVNKKLQDLHIGSYSVFVDRANKKMIVNSQRHFDSFEFMKFEVVCEEEISEIEEIIEDIPDAIEDFSFPEMNEEMFK